MRAQAAALAALFFAFAPGAHAAGPAGAQASSATAAEALFSEGRDLLAAGSVDAACPKFAESYRLDPALGSLLNLASCHEKQGKTASAWSEYREAAALAKHAGDARRQELADERAAALEPGLSRLRVMVAHAAPGLTVTRDGMALGAASIGAALPVDPGEHAIGATAPGQKPFTTRVPVPRGTSVVVEVPALEAIALPPPPAESAVSGRQTAGVVVGVTGLIALSAGSAFAVLAAQRKSYADDRCPDKQCDGAGLAAIDGARAYAWTADIGIGVGAALALAGGYLLLTSDAHAPGSACTVTPIVSAHGAGASAAIAF